MNRTRTRTLTAAALASALAVAVAVPAGAATPPYSVVQHEPFGPATMANCRDRETTVGLELCAISRTVAVDRQIDATALAIRTLRDPAAAAHLDAAQKAWVAFRTADCVSAGDLDEGGTASGIITAQCETADSTARLKTLKQQLAALRQQD